MGQLKYVKVHRHDEKVETGKRRPTNTMLQTE